MVPHLSHQPHADWPPVCHWEVSATLQRLPHKLLVSSWSTTRKSWKTGHREPVCHEAPGGGWSAIHWTAVQWGPIQCGGGERRDGGEGMEEKGERGREGSPLPLTPSASKEPFLRSVWSFHIWSRNCTRNLSPGKKQSYLQKKKKKGTARIFINSIIHRRRTFKIAPTSKPGGWVSEWCATAITARCRKKHDSQGSWQGESSQQQASAQLDGRNLVWTTVLWQGDLGVTKFLLLAYLYFL